jgi:hypothetical protein
MPRESERELEVVIRFKSSSGDYVYDKEMEQRRIEEAAKDLAENLRKFGYQFHDVKRMDSNNQDKMKRSFIIVLTSRQTPEELKRRLDSMHGSRSWTYCEVF